MGRNSMNKGKNVPSGHRIGLAVTAARLGLPLVALVAGSTALANGAVTLNDKLNPVTCEADIQATQPQLCPPEPNSHPIFDPLDVAVIAGVASAALELNAFNRGNRLPDVINRGAKIITDKIDGPIITDTAQNNDRPFPSDPFFGR